MAGISFTSLPDIWTSKLEALIERPPVHFEAPGDYWREIAIDPKIINKKAIEDIRALTDSNLQGRRAGTAGETKAMVYIEEQLKALHLLAFGEENNYWQIFSIPAVKETVINGRALFRPDPADRFLIRPPISWLQFREGSQEDRYHFRPL